MPLRRPVAAIWAIVGGVVVVLGPAFPFVKQPDVDLFHLIVLNPAALVLSGLFGVALTGLALAMLTGARGPAIAEVVLSSLGLCGYCIFAGAGTAGIPADSGFGFSTTVKWDPGLGLLLSIFGCLVALAAAVHGLRGSRVRRRS